MKINNTCVQTKRNSTTGTVQFLLLLICLFFSFSSFAAPTVSFGSAPTWVTTVEVSTKQPSLRDIRVGYYIQLFEREMNVATGEAYQHLVRNIVTYVEVFYG